VLAEQIARIRADNARLLQRLEATERRFRAISRGVLRAQEAERSRISRDLHDGVGQSLTALKMQLDLLARDADTSASPLAPRLAALRDVANAALQEIRQISHTIRPQILDNLGLVPTLRWVVRTFEERNGVKASLACSELQNGRDPDVETLLYRITQESLTNVTKHARASRVLVELREEPDTIRLRVEDDGAGFDVRAVEAREHDIGFGLQSMRDRVQLFGGRFAVRSAPGSGTTVEVTVPADAAREVAP
jgi:two-component system, NarL family, sensor kinase